MFAILMSSWAWAAEPAGWHLSGNAAQAYRMETDSKIKYEGAGSAHYYSADDPGDGFGTMMQQIAPDAYAGQRIRFSAMVKSKDLDGWAGLWLRVDGAVKGQPLSFDNMQDRPIRGTSDWRRYEVVLDVADAATNIAFGVLIDGTGDVWIDDVKLEEVDASTPVTGARITHPNGPVNLDFESDHL